jgi:hypothetical protein
MEVYLNFIGNISVPIGESDLEEELTPAELEKIERKRQRANERCRAYRERKKQRQAAEKIVVENTENSKSAAENPNPAA